MIDVGDDDDVADVFASGHGLSRQDLEFGGKGTAKKRVEESKAASAAMISLIKWPNHSRWGYNSKG